MSLVIFFGKFTIVPEVKGLSRRYLLQFIIWIFFLNIYWLKVKRTFHLFTFHLGFVHPQPDVALHQCLPLSSNCCFPVQGGSPFLCHLAIFYLVVSLISSLSLVATLCSVQCTYCPPFLLYVQPISNLFQCVFYNVSYIHSFPYL